MASRFWYRSIGTRASWRQDFRRSRTGMDCLSGILLSHHVCAYLKTSYMALSQLTSISIFTEEAGCRVGGRFVQGLLRDNSRFLCYERCCRKGREFGSDFSNVLTKDTEHRQHIMQVLEQKEGRL